MELAKRKKNRVKGYEYNSNGVYFVTICTKDKKKILSQIVKNDGYYINVGDGLPVPRMTQYGIIVDNYINKIYEKYPMVNVNKYVIMPNHIHLILSIYNENGTENPSPTVGDIIGWFKYNVTKNINQINKTVGIKIFQRSFHNHIVRNKNDYEMIWKYIDANPLTWENDCFY